MQAWTTAAPRCRRATAWLAARTAAVFCAALSACGGGGNSGPAEPPAPTTVDLAGLVADRSVWAGAEVAFTCSDGVARQVRAAPDGRYALTLPRPALPCLLRATASGGQALWSAAVAGGTVNVTLGSDWVVSRALHRSTAGLQADASLLGGLGANALAQVQTELRLALAASGLTAGGDLVTTPLAGADDALLAAQQLVQQTLAARGAGPLLLRHALALQPDAAALRDALAQGRLAAALGLPSAEAGSSGSPQLVSGLVSLLTGPADTLFGVNVETSWRSVDGGLQWTALDQPLAQVLRVRGRLWARDHDGLLVSDDGGLHWAAAAGAPAACRFDADQLWLSPQGRLWFFPDSSCAGVRDHFTDDGERWQSQPWDGGLFRLDALQTLAHRLPPLRQIFFRDAGRERVTSCLDGDCVDVQVLDWPYVQSLWPVLGSGEVVAGLSDSRTGRAALRAIGSDGIRWTAMTTMPANVLVRLPQGGLLASPGADPVAVPGVNPRVQRSDDNGQSWRPSDPAVNARDGWLALGSDTRTRPAGSAVELSTDGGASWSTVPEIAAERDRRTWLRSPDGTLLRTGVAAVQASTDNAASWRDVVTWPATSFGVRVTAGPVWLGDRWALVLDGRLLTSSDGLQWAEQPLAQAVAAAFTLPGQLAADGGIWVFMATHQATPASPVQTVLLESRDQGRGWVDSQRSDAFALACGGLRTRWRAAEGGAADWQLRTDDDASWRTLPLPPGVERVRSLDLDCAHGLLRLRVGAANSATRLPYFNPTSGARGISHWLSPDHGAQWFRAGRPGTDLFLLDRRWWSVGLDSVTRWP